MAKRKRNPNRAGTQQNRVRTSLKSGSGQKSPKPEQGGPRKTGQTDAGNEAQKPQYEWVTIEHRDADGNLTLPKELIATTHQRRYGEVPHGSEIKVHVLAGYKPKVMMVERKIYEIHRLSVRGWRRSGQITVELEGWRGHEADWFNAMRGAGVEISDPGLPDPHNEKSDYTVSKSSFGRKIVTLVGENDRKTKVQVYEGTLDITETWKSAWQRQGVEVLNLGFKLLLAPLLVALGAGLALLWLDRSPISDDRNSDIRENPTEQGVQARNGDAVSEPSDQATIYQSPDVPAKRTTSDKQDSTESAPKSNFSREVSSHDGNERVP